MTSSDDPSAFQVQHGVLDQPDPARPDFAFRDDSYLVQVAVMPAATPVWMGHGQSVSGIVDALLHAVVFRIAARADPRWKIVTFRQPKPPSIPRVVGLEFCATFEAANARQDAIIRTWQPGQSAHHLPIKTLARGTARRTG